MKSAWLLLVCVVCLTLFPVFQGKFYAIGDTRDVFIPLETFFRAEQLAGRVPAWNPDISWGFPVIASAQIGFFYPPLLLTRFLPVWLYLPLNLVAHFLFLAVGTYLFLRKLNRSPAAAYLGAISFTLSAFVIQHITHLNIIFAISWLPWLLLYFNPFTLAMPFLAGQIQVPFLMALVSSAYYIYSSLDKERLGGILKQLVLIALFSVGIAAVQLFPTAELALQSTRGTNSDFDIVRANQYSWPLYHAPTLLFPRFFGSGETYWGKPLQIEMGFFIGTIPLLLAMLALFSPLRREGWWVGVVVITFLLALGSWSPFQLIGIEPSLWFFSAPARWLLFTTFGLSTLAAYGLDNFPPLEPARRIGGKGRWLRLATAGVVTLVALANIALFNISDDFFEREKLNSLVASARKSSVSLTNPYTALPVIILAGAPFLINIRRGRRILLALTSVELIVIAGSFSPAIPWREILPPSETITRLPESVVQNQSRLHSLRSDDVTGAYFTNPETNESAVDRRELRQLLVPLIHSQFGLPGVAWPASLDLSRPATVLHAINEQLKRGETGLAEETNVGAVLYPGVNVVHLNPKPRASLLLANGTEIPAEYREITPSHIEIKANSPEPATLIVRDTFYPGWHATVDSNDEVELQPADPNGIFRAINVPAGKHIVEMKYQPVSLQFGLALSIASAAITGFTFLHRRRTLPV